MATINKESDGGGTTGSNLIITADPEGNRDTDTTTGTNKKSAPKPRFNWKHRFLTSHGSAGSDGQVCTCESWNTQQQPTLTIHAVRKGEAVVQFHSRRK